MCTPMSRAKSKHISAGALMTVNSSMVGIVQYPHALPRDVREILRSNFLIPCFSLVSLSTSSHPILSLALPGAQRRKSAASEERGAGKGRHVPASAHSDPERDKRSDQRATICRWRKARSLLGPQSGRSAEQSPWKEERIRSRVFSGAYCYDAPDEISCGNFLCGGSIGGSEFKSARLLLSGRLSVLPRHVNAGGSQPYENKDQ